MGVQIPDGKGQFCGGKGHPIVKYRDTLRSSVKTAEPIEMPWDGAILGERVPHLKYRHFLPWAVQKWLNRLICRLGCGLGCAEGCTSSVVFARWRQCALPCGKYDLTVRVRRRCGLTSNYFDHLLYCLVLSAIYLYAKGLSTLCKKWIAFCYTDTSLYVLKTNLD